MTDLEREVVDTGVLTEVAGTVSTGKAELGDEGEDRAADEKGGGGTVSVSTELGVQTPREYLA